VLFTFSVHLRKVKKSYDKNIIYDPSRVGPPINMSLGESNLSTYMSGETENKYGVMNDVREMAARLNIPEVIVDLANHLFMQVCQIKCMRGNNMCCIGTACLYLACREHGVPRTLKELCAVSDMSSKQIGRYYRQIGELLKRKPDNAAYIARKTMQMGLVCGRGAIALIAASIYMATKICESDKRSQKEIVAIAGVADATLRQTYKLMCPRAKHILPPQYRASKSALFICPK
uniref:Transcription initiation factor IIB n=1 Tax=Denticeps clupeoides TaxID=299321 RepID=A0AAY4B8E7_9TELE